MNKWTVNSIEEGKRLLTHLKERFGTEFTTKDLRWAVEHHHCRINGRVERFCSHRLKKEDVIEFSIIKKPKFDFEFSRLLFENEELICYNKPIGISSEDLSKSLGLFLVHRLDRDTSGVFLLAKTPMSQTAIENLFRERAIEKSYAALVLGKTKELRGVIENEIAKIGEKAGEGKWGVVARGKGSYAKTEWKLEACSEKYSFLRCWPLTGRTHQIRVHLSSIGHPILGDLRYGHRFSQGFQPFRPLLHAESLAFILPGRNEKIHVEAPFPDDFLEGLRLICHHFEK